MPLIPTPMCASIIIDTSFAPSPIDNVIQPPFNLAKPTTSAFYLGDTLQQITEEAKSPNLKNIFAVSVSLKVYESVGPSIIIQTL